MLMPLKVGSAKLKLFIARVLRVGASLTLWWSTAVGLMQSKLVGLELIVIGVIFPGNMLKATVPGWS